MRKLLLLVLLLSATIAMLLWFRSRQHHAASAGTAMPATQDRALLPEPGVSMQINGHDSLAVLQDTPLLISVWLGSPNAANAVLQQESDRAAASLLRESAGRGELPKQRADALAAHIPAPTAIPALRLGSAGKTMDEFVQFMERESDGRLRPLSWKVKLLSGGLAGSITIVAEQTFELKYALESSASPVGEHTIVAVLEVPTKVGASTSWQGRVESDPVQLTLVLAGAASSSEKQTSMYLKAQYFYVIGDLPQALATAQNMLTADPNDQGALMLAGDIKEKQGNAQGAMDDYQHALAIFEAQKPKPQEDPLGLIVRMRALRKKLR